MDLINKRCKHDVLPLRLEEITNLIEQTPDWNLNTDRIEKDFKFWDFKLAIEFINKVAELAENENHHPDINLYNYKNVKIILSTHAVKGLSENDFILAAKIDQIFGGSYEN